MSIQIRAGRVKTGTHCRKAELSYHAGGSLNRNVLSASASSGALAAGAIRGSLALEGLLAGLEWRISPAPFLLTKNQAEEIESLGRVLLQFYRAVNLLYRKSVEGRQPEWVARWLDQGKPAGLLELQRSHNLKNDVT